MTTDFDLIVVGEGIAGLTCAAEAASLGLKVASFEAEFLGGLVVNVNALQRFDEAGGLSGMDHAATLARANAKAGVRSVQAPVSAVRADGAGFVVDSDDGVFTARAVVLATGARLARLGVPGEAEYEGRGVSHCADCDAPMFSGRTVVVAGGGPWALQDALLLTQEGVTVNLVFEGDAPTADAAARQQLADEPGIRCWPRTRVESVLGDGRAMTGVRLRDASGATQDLPCAGLFALAALAPNSAPAPEAVQRDSAGALVTGDDLQTALPGLYAIGQVRAGFGGWLSEAVAEARRAAQAVKAAKAQWMAQR